MLFTYDKVNGLALSKVIRGNSDQSFTVEKCDAFTKGFCAVELVVSLSYNSHTKLNLESCFLCAKGHR